MDESIIELSKKIERLNKSVDRLINVIEDLDNNNFNVMVPGSGRLRVKPARVRLTRR